MLFEVDGSQYESAEMHHFITGNPAEPELYVTADRKRAFVRVISAAGRESRWVEASGLERRRLGTRYGIVGLGSV